MKPLPRLVRVEEFERLRSRPLAVVFKHSTMCPVSTRARHEIRAIAQSLPELEVHEVQVIESRELSNYIAAATGISHESPQVLVLRDGEVVWHDSHFGVTARAIASAVA